MISEKENTNISKFLSLVLRHQPQLIGITLDEQGWVNINELIERANSNGQNLTHEIVNHVVETNAKKRFAFDEKKQKIRASQGHSVEVELGYQPQTPPEILYHGTDDKSVQSILSSGLEKRSRQHIHLSDNLETAVKVGQRHGKPVVFNITAGEMHQQGYLFYLSENGVWLTDVVPQQFLKLNE